MTPWRLLSRWASPGGTAGSLTVLFFHRVMRMPDPLLPDEPGHDEFDRLLGLLRSQFTLMPLQEAIGRLRQGRLPPAAAAVTFDDGYDDNLEVAAPLLLKHNVPATFFIASDFMKGGAMWNDCIIETLRRTTIDEVELPALGIERLHLATMEQRRAAVIQLLARLKYLPYRERLRAVQAIAEALRVTRLPPLMMGPAQVQALVGQGFDIGAHTCSHPILMQLDDASAEREIVDARRHLEDVIDRPVALFAYPNGRENVDFDSRHCTMARLAGFEAALTTDPGVCRQGSDLMRLPRFTPWDRRPTRFRLQLLRNQLART